MGLPSAYLDEFLPLDWIYRFSLNLHVIKINCGQIHFYVIFYDATLCSM